MVVELLGVEGYVGDELDGEAGWVVAVEEGTFWEVVG